MLAEGILLGDLDQISNAKGFVRKEKKWQKDNIDELVKAEYRENCLRKFEILKQNPNYGKNRFIFNPITGKFH